MSRKERVPRPTKEVEVETSAGEEAAHILDPAIPSSSADIIEHFEYVDEDGFVFPPAP